MRLILAAALWAAGLLGLPAHALAATAHLSLNPASGPPGTAVVATGTGFCSAPGCSTVSITFSGVQVRTGVQVDSNGSFQASFTVPGGTPAGSNFVVAQQTDKGQSNQATATFDITPSAPPSSSATTTKSSSSTSLKSSTTSFHITTQSTSASSTPHATASPSASAMPTANAANAGQGGAGSGGGGHGIPGLVVVLLVLLGAGAGTALGLRWREISARKRRPA